MGGTIGRPPPRRRSNAPCHVGRHRQARNPAHPSRRASGGTSFGKAERKNRAAPPSVPSGGDGTSSAEHSK
eukprot:scaffold4279_cov99-Isochrysis_galbana.AAC.9